MTEPMRTNILASEDLFPGTLGKIENNVFLKITFDDIHNGISADLVYASIEEVKEGNYCSVYNHKMVWCVDKDTV